MKKIKRLKKPIPCMCKDGMLNCKYLADYRIETYIPNQYFYICEKHYQAVGKQIEDRFNEMRGYIMKEALKKAKEIKAKEKRSK